MRSLIFMLLPLLPSCYAQQGGFKVAAHYDLPSKEYASISIVSKSGKTIVTKATFNSLDEVVVSQYKKTNITLICASVQGGQFSRAYVWAFREDNGFKLISTEAIAVSSVSASSLASGWLIEWSTAGRQGLSGLPSNRRVERKWRYVEKDNSLSADNWSIVR